MFSFRNLNNVHLNGDVIFASRTRHISGLMLERVNIQYKSMFGVCSIRCLYSRRWTLTKVDTYEEADDNQLPDTASSDN